MKLKSLKTKIKRFLKVVFIFSSPGRSQWHLICHGAASVVRPMSNISFKQLLLENHQANFNQTW